MKILIWVLGYAVMTLVYILTAGILANAGSFALWIESIAFFVAWIWVSIVLCKKWDNHKTGKCSWQTAMEKVAESGMSVNEYAKQGLTEDFLLGLPKLTYENMKSVLKAKVCKGEITEAQYVILLKKLSWTPGKDEFPKL